MHNLKDKVSKFPDELTKRGEYHVLVLNGFQAFAPNWQARLPVPHAVQEDKDLCFCLPSLNLSKVQPVPSFSRLLPLDLCTHLDTSVALIRVGLPEATRDERNYKAVTI